MEYIKVPYVRLNGKKYGGDLSSSDQNDIQQTVISFLGEDGSSVYGNLTFQELAKKYQSGEDPTKDAPANVSGIISNPENILAIHKAIVAVANKFGYSNDVPNIKTLIGNIDLEIYQIFTQSPNSYFVTTFTDRDNALIITDEDGVVTGILLSSDVDHSQFVTADKNNNLLIPKEAYDQDLNVA